MITKMADKSPDGNKWSIIASYYGHRNTNAQRNGTTYGL